MDYKNWFRKYLVPIVICGVLFGLIIFVDVFRSELWAKPVFEFLNREAMVLSAAAAVTLAAAAVWAVRTTADQTRMMIVENRRIYDEDKELDFRRRTLDEIVNWVTEVRRDCIPPPGAGKEAFREWGRRVLTIVSSKGDWVTMTADVFGHEFRENVSNANEVIMAFCNKLREIGESSEITDEAIQEMMAQQFKSVVIATSSVLADALKLKIEYKL